MNIKRISSGLIGFAFVVLVFIFGNAYLLDAIVSIVALISMYEYIHCFKSTNKAKPISWMCYGSCLLITILHIIKMEYIVYIIAIFIPLAIMILFMHVIISELKITINDIAVTFFGIFYIVMFYMFIPLVYGGANGKFYIWYLVFISWGTDVFAYAIGRRFGKHKFSKVSPNKSIEGCIAGLVGAVVLSIIYTIVINNVCAFNINYLLVIGMAISLSLIGQVGDFAASSIKRYVGVKDFGNLIPGHGGMLDRFDSLMFIAPFAFFFLLLL